VTAPLLEVRDLVRVYRLRRQGLFGPRAELRAVDGVSFTVEAGRSLAVVGESGSGKSTLARAVMALERPSAGDVRLRGESLFAMTPARLRAVRRDFKLVFQDPYGSLDPRLPVGASVGDPLAAAEPRMTRAERAQRVAEALVAVGLRPTDATRYPHEFSGGQRQRIAIARAIVTRPALIVADEPVSSLDVSVQAQVLNLLQELRERFGVAYLFISHNLAVVRHVADEMAVMKDGRFVEQGPVERIFARPEAPYTRALLDAMLAPRPRRRGA
jgi:ABC-type microcin C transport system duplicated ATPase subunit YejF